jgi:hypothetical protein
MNTAQHGSAIPLPDLFSILHPWLDETDGALLGNNRFSQSEPGSALPDQFLSVFMCE